MARYFAEHTEWDITVVCDDDPTLQEELPAGVRYIPVSMKRGISLSGISSVQKLYSRLGYGSYMNSRMETLLGKFGFEGRWKPLLCPEQYLDCEYSEVDAIMDDEQQKALGFIREVLKAN